MKASERRIYLDNAATTPLCSAAREAMLRWADAGNPSSLYAEGRSAKAALDEARETLASKLRAGFAEVIFTSSGTESAALAILGAAAGAQDGDRKKILFGAAEHHCVLNTREILERLGFSVGLLPVDRWGRVGLDELTLALQTGEVLLVAVMHANNEIGSINDMPAIAGICHANGSLLFCDAVQSFGKIPVLVDDLGADLLSVSAHKICGPKGAGGLYVRPGTILKPLFAGGGQERELRGGTENVAAIAGFAAAISDIGHVGCTKDLKVRLVRGLVCLGAIPSLPEEVPQLNSHVHVRFRGHSAESLLIRLDRLGVSAGSGAACSSGSIEASHVMLACGYSPHEAKEAVRFTLGAQITEADIGETMVRISQVLQ